MFMVPTVSGLVNALFEVMKKKKLTVCDKNHAIHHLIFLVYPK